MKEIPQGFLWQIIFLECKNIEITGCYPPQTKKYDHCRIYNKIYGADQFVSRLVEKEQDRVYKLETGLKTEIRKQVIPYELTTYANVVNKVLIIEREVNEERVEREKSKKKK